MTFAEGVREYGWRSELSMLRWRLSKKWADYRLRRRLARGLIQLHLEPPRWFVKPYPRPYSKSYVMDRYTGRPTISDPWSYAYLADAHEHAKYYNEHGTDARDHDYIEWTEPRPTIEVVTEAVKHAREQGWIS